MTGNTGRLDLLDIAKKKAIEDAAKGASDTSQPAEPVKKPEAAEEKKEEVPEAKCKHCGRDPHADPKTPSADDLLDFTRAVWSGREFTKAFSFFGGAAHLILRSIDADELTATQRATLTDNAKEDSTGLVGAFALFDRAEEYQCALAIVQLQVGDRTYAQPEKVDGVTLDPRVTVAAIKKFSGNQVIYQLIRNTYREFAELIRNIISVGSDPSFPLATPPAGPSPASPTPATQG